MEGMFDGLQYLVYGSMLLWPLGLWKLVDIIIWFCHHISWV